VLWDAVADPLLGWLSDRTRSRLGQRIPWMLAGTPLLVGCFIWLFSIPAVATSSDTVVFWYAMLINIGLNTAMSMVAIPHLALGQDITRDPEVRTSLYAWRTLMALLGLLTGILVPVVCHALDIRFAPAEQGHAVITSVIAVLVVAVTLASVWRYRRSSVAGDEPELSLNALAGTIDRRPLLLLMAAFFVATLGQGLNSTLALYYYRYRLALDEDALGLVLVVFIVSLCMTLPLWVMASRRIGKATLVAIGTLGLGVLSMAVYPFLPAGSIAGPMCMAVAGGIFLGSTGLLESLLVDVADHARVPSAMMGRLFGVWKFVSKAARAIAIALGGFLLGAIGYQSGQASVPTEVSDAIGWLFGPGVGVFFVLAAVIALRIRRVR
jgi:Na+/melibiose symporter-like transporter